jgi:hypothetical protein
MSNILVGYNITTKENGAYAATDTQTGDGYCELGTYDYLVSDHAGFRPKAAKIGRKSEVSELYSVFLRESLSIGIGFSLNVFFYKLASVFIHVSKMSIYLWFEFQIIRNVIQFVDPLSVAI